MKKFCVLLILLGTLSTNVLAEEIAKPQAVIHTDAPVWAEYVAPKYRNPRLDFSKKASITELAVGIVLTELIITSPIGIPMTVHGTTKVKMIS